MLAVDRVSEREVRSMWTRESFAVCRPVMLLLLLLAPAEAQVPEAAGEAVTPRERLDDLRARAIAPEVPAERLGLILRPFEAEEIEEVVRHWLEYFFQLSIEIVLIPALAFSFSHVIFSCGNL